MEDPMNSRVFCVCGKSIEAEVLTKAFSPYGNIQSVKLVRDKGVAYVKYDKASSAAAAIEALHETVLNDGRGPMLKVMPAEAPTRRSGPVSRMATEIQLAPDPDNIPPRSRLFMVVPKTAIGSAIEEAMSQFRDLEYCKIDLIPSKGIVFCKYSKSSSALLALEAILGNDNMVAGYKVKCMIAEPKGKRGRLENQNFTDLFTSPISPLDYATNHNGPYTPLGAGYLLPQSPSISGNTPPSNSDSHTASGNLTSSLTSCTTPNQGLGTVNPQQLHARMQSAASNVDMSSIGGLGNGYSSERAGLQDNPAFTGQFNTSFLGLHNLQAIAAHLGAANLAQLNTPQQGLGGLQTYATGSMPVGRPSTLHVTTPQQEDEHSLSIGGSERMMRGSPSHLLRLYVVHYKGASEAQLTAVFNQLPGMEYCDLKRDHATGMSRGFCYVKYNNSQSAIQAIESLNGAEFPVGTGFSLKVMYADPLHVPKSGRATPLLGPSRSGSIHSDSNSSFAQHRSLIAGEEVSSAENGESGTDLQEHRVEVAAVQNSLAHMSMPHNHNTLFDGLQPVKSARKPLAPSPGGEQDVEQVAESEPAPTPEPLVVPDEFTLFTTLTRPMPNYALQHVFSTHGTVEWVLLRPDERYSVVRFAEAEAAVKAMQALNGTSICGEALTVTTTDPTAGSRNSKRPRVAE